MLDEMPLTIDDREAAAVALAARTHIPRLCWSGLARVGAIRLGARPSIGSMRSV